MKNKLLHEPINPEKRSKPAPGLYIVATPIGNLGDVTLRALEILGAVDVIACEDTRVTKRLLTKYGVATPLTLYHEHNAVRATPRLLQRLQDGAAVALVSDAGTPLISDPGYRLVQQVHEANYPVFVVPGPSAPIAALVASGLPSNRFLFAGFLPTRQSARRKSLAELTDLHASLVFLESPRRLARSLLDMLSVLGHREAAVARELTKRYEEVVRGSLKELVDHYANTQAPKGEVVVIIGPPIAEVDVVKNEATLDDLLTIALASMSVRDAARSVSIETGLPRRDAYRRALTLLKINPA